ncbi:hypothetical protein [Candidatus Hecatella orcuttiae]|jgi:hypothetical protein|uniref:hypothetical protein n=1 Tax=Candidatus Hecatella orcuttiae TaxID=1935119 RepID=UPI002867C02B|nr:hypothetical protein [Candidatus Hecatella orcuttiae]
MKNKESKPQYSKISLKVIKRLRKFGHPKAEQVLKALGFKITYEKDISSKPYDFIAEKNGATYYIDAKVPLKRCSISISELKGMDQISRRGIPLYLFILPDSSYLLFKLEASTSMAKASRSKQKINKFNSSASAASA